MVLVHIPLLYYLNHALSHNSKTCHKWICNCAMVMCVIVQLFWVLTAYPYGYLALLLSPGVTWSLVLTFWMVYKALTK